jgi:hypothetical protein
VLVSKVQPRWRIAPSGSKIVCVEKHSPTAAVPRVRCGVAAGRVRQLFTGGHGTLLTSSGTRRYAGSSTAGSRCGSSQRIAAACACRCPACRWRARRAHPAQHRLRDWRCRPDYRVADHGARSAAREQPASCDTRPGPLQVYVCVTESPTRHARPSRTYWSANRLRPALDRRSTIDRAPATEPKKNCPTLDHRLQQAEDLVGRIEEVLQRQMIAAMMFPRQLEAKHARHVADRDRLFKQLAKR